MSAAGATRQALGRAAVAPRNGRHRRVRRACFAIAVGLGVVLGGCASQEAGTSGAGAGEPRVVRQVDLPLLPGAAAGERTFRGRDVQGGLDASGRWRIRGQITHPRLLCASYQLGLRFGSSDGDCADAQWRTDTALLPSRRQCNNATLIHDGEGTLGLAPEALSALNCVLVTVRCTGTCG